MTGVKDDLANRGVTRFMMAVVNMPEGALAPEIIGESPCNVKLVSRLAYLQRMQEPGESSLGYLLELRKLAKGCDWKTVTESDIEMLMMVKSLNKPGENTSAVMEVQSDWGPDCSRYGRPDVEPVVMAVQRSYDPLLKEAVDKIEAIKVNNEVKDILRKFATVFED